MKLNICFIGLGSIGTRHLRNIKKLLTERRIEYTVDALRSSKRPLSDEVCALIDNQFFKEEQLGTDYDICFITNPTVLHYKAIEQMIPRARHLFVEKPLFESVQYDLSQLPFRSGSIFYVAAPLRHSLVFEKIQEFVANHKIFCARAICSSYLPDWRKGVDYRRNYSAQRALGGGVALDLIHEWDYLYSLFGRPSTCFQMHGRYSDLEIDSDDLACYLAIYPDKLVELHLDYFGRVAKRSIQLFSRDCVLTADFRNNCLVEETGMEQKKTCLPERDSYIVEMNRFLDLCLGKTKENPNDMQHAYQTLKIALGDCI